MAYVIVEAHLQPLGVPPVIDGLCREGVLVLRLELEVHATEVESLHLLTLRLKFGLVDCFVDSDEKLCSPLTALCPHGPFEDDQARSHVDRKLWQLYIKKVEHSLEKQHCWEAEARIEKGFEHHYLVALWLQNRFIPRC